MCSFEIFERSSMVECDEIESRLFLGNLDAAESEETLKCFGITHVLTVYMFPITKPENLEIETLFIDLEDSPDCDILSCFERSNAFIKEGQDKGGCLVHCYGGVSRSATLVVAYLMKKYSIGVDEALQKVKNKRYCACPNAGFLSQLRLYENMKNTLDEENIDYKIFSLYHLGRKVSSGGNFSAVLPQNYLSKFRGKMCDGDKYKCRKCRKCLFYQSNIIPHIKGQDLYWNNFAQQLISEQSQVICTNSLFIEFLPWMSEAFKTLSGKIVASARAAKKTKEAMTIEIKKEIMDKHTPKGLTFASTGVAILRYPSPSDDHLLDSLPRMQLKNWNILLERSTMPMWCYYITKF
ncbi:dual specificity protein phosphatase MPK-4-like isoform X2 [Stegodyphus dumicola]|uniref:dual specificity protein phosphatase MPK-4-like isoform X2 n=1 Tax=Stegodyphus dumicola TaxID=202533 RepID=UPI0015B32047|nr:dual specificity protein phosphatase MPK-4-like isoform X2 [Stegodyphus dumicola]